MKCPCGMMDYNQCNPNDCPEEPAYYNGYTNGFCQDPDPYNPYQRDSLSWTAYARGTAEGHYDYRETQRTYYPEEFLNV